MNLLDAGRVFSVRNLKSFLPLLVFVAVTLLIGATYYSSFRKIEAMIQEEELHSLGAIADTKVAEIARWRDRQQRLAEAFSQDSILAAEFGQWLQEGAPSNGRKQRLQKMLAELQFSNRYKSLFLLDKQGIIRLSLNDGSAPRDAFAQMAVQVMSRREEVFSDLHRSNYADKGISIELISPLVVAGKESVRITGAVVLQIDPEEFLYPLIRSWPAPSASAETLLVRQDGDDVLFLSNVRHQKDTALTQRMPLSTGNLPSALAIHGVSSTVEGVDYRGIPVVSQMRQVKGMPWFLVSKVDREELFAPVSRLKQWSIGLVMVYLVIGGLLMFVWLQGYKTRYRHLKAQHAAAVEREMLVKHYEYLTKHANDIILVTDDAGNVIDANERAVQAYGYTRNEMLHMRIPDLRDPAEDPAVFRGQIEQISRLGALRYETVARRKDRTLFPVEVSARLIEVRGTRFLQGIIRDVSERKQAEVALRKSEALLKASQRMAQIGSWELDLTNNFLYWSEENYRIFEYDPALHHASYEIFLDKVHPDDRSMVDKVYTDSVKNKTSYTVVHRLLFADGRIKFVREWCDTLYDEAGRPLRSTGTTQDITEQQLAQDALRKSAGEIEDLYNHAPCGYHSLDKDGVIIKINDTLLHWLGYTREEVVGKVKVADLLSVSSRRLFQGRFTAFMERGSVHDIEYELVRKDGSLLPVSLSSTAVYDSAGHYSTCRTTTFDISARKLVENKLSESEERFRTMADNAPIMIWMADATEGTSYRGCNFFNQRWHEFTGLALPEAQGKNWLDIVHPDDRKLCIESYRNAFRKARPFKVEYRLRRYDGAFRWIEDSGVPRFTGSNEFLGFIGTSTDISEHKLFETMRAEMEHIDRFNIAGEMTSGIAHELNQPLAAANNYLNACLHRLQEGNWDSEGLKKTIGLAHDQTVRAGQIIAHFKDMIRKKKAERAMLDINLLISDCIKYLEHELQQHFISVTLNISTLPPVYANKIEIEQVLINLMKNAIDSMSATSVRELRIVTRVVGSSFVLVTVSDTGVGIAPEDMDKIFNPFHTSKKDGLGLGLSICRSLIDNYGGKIWAEPNEGAGTEFNFTLTSRGGYE